MKWVKVSDYALCSTCERYSVAKTFHGERVNYAAWLRGEPPQVLGDFDNAAGAKACCENHAARHTLKDAA